MPRLLLKPAGFQGVLSEATQRVTDISELKPLGVSELLIPHHQGFLKTSEQK